MQAMRRERQATQADAQRNIGVHLARAYAPGTFDMITRHPRHGTNAFDPFEGSEVQRMLEGSGDGTRVDVGPLSDALFPTEVTENTLPDDRSAPTLHQDMVMRQSEQQTQARDRAEQQRARAEWETVMAASRAAQRDGSVGRL
eukprot:COSAG05_NODE_1807_length_4044_cov_3.445881_2_plen_143_part_00